VNQGWVKVTQVKAPLTTLQVLDVKKGKEVFKVNIDAAGSGEVLGFRVQEVR
jgi:hypothetical protein